MTSFPRSLTRLPATFLHMAALPAFFLVAVLLYEPRALDHLMESGSRYLAVSNVRTFNTVICFAIILVSMVLTRMALWLVRRHFPADLWRYSFWCLGEIVVMCAFTGLYLVLVDRSSEGGFFNYFGRGITSIGSVLIYPYIIIGLLYLVGEKPRLASAEQDARLKFYDSRHQLKFITEASSVVFIESNENYIVIHYLENGLEKKYQLRNSMKNIEPLCEKAGFARTHRSYIVNPLHVKLIRREPGGVNVADVGLDEGIPISKKYYESFSAIL